MDNIVLIPKTKALWRLLDWKKVETLNWEAGESLLFIKIKLGYIENPWP
jgi:hypothetical protein